MPTPSSLEGRIAVVTGVSRDIGIGAAIARRLDAEGAVVHATGWPAHDAEMPWGTSEVTDLPFEVHRHDLEDASQPAALLDEALVTHGAVDIVIATHARSSHRGLAEVEPDELDRCWRANVRSVLLLAQRFAEIHQPAPSDDPPRGRMIWFTSGQHLEPMPDEIAYSVSKGALHQMTASVNRALAASRIVANCINPGPVDTGYAVGDFHETVARHFPDGRWGAPDDIADVVAFLTGDQGSWIRGQVLDVEGGFDRYASFGRFD